MALQKLTWRLNDLLYRGSIYAFLKYRKIVKGPKYMDTQVLFFPEFPAGFNYVVRKFVGACGVRFRPLSRIHLEELSENFFYRAYLKLFGVRSEVNRTFIYAYEDNTKSLVDVEKHVRESEGVPEGKEYRFINSGCMDISKQEVSRCMNEVFGYSTIVDPLTFDQKMVRKSDTNGIHDGEVVQGPLQASDLDDDSVYQRIVDNTAGSDMVQDLRLVVVGQQIPVLYRKQRPLNDRFSNTNTIVFLEEPESYFSKEELDNIRKFMGVFRLDICEMDVLRDKNDKQIYVVDVNRTVSGPPNHLGIPKSIKAVSKIAAAFEEEFLQKW